MTRKDQRKNLDLLATLNREHLNLRPENGELDARMSSYELAYRMQMEVPGILDLKGETEKTKEAYLAKLKTTLADRVVTKDFLNSWIGKF